MGDLELRVVTSIAADDVVTTLESSADLAFWEGAAAVLQLVTSELDGAGHLVRIWQVPVFGASVFLRMKVTAGL